MPGTRDRQPDPSAPTLFDSRPAVDAPRTTTGRDHPATSHAAAARALPRSGTQRRRVLDLLRGVWPDGLTDEEIRKRLGVPFGSGLARRNELAGDGWVEDSGDRRDTDAGAQAIVWRYVPDERSTA